MDADDHVCLCFHVSQRKICNYLKRERPCVASKMSDCLSAGTGCGWCVPFLEQLHRNWAAGEEPQLRMSHASYADRRNVYRTRKQASDALPSDEDSSSD